ncbi:MAG: Crp/Fnr family transcriptional regulator [Bacteroidales bacterium]|nr:Crp/Fnr family transcriptional regulator [Bacteroidales bacterium]
MDLLPDVSAILIQRFPFLDADLRIAIEESGKLMSAAKGDEILQEGRYIQSFPIVLEGCLRIVRYDNKGNELLLYYLNPGEACSMALTCCMGQQLSNISAIAEQESLIIRIPVVLLDQWMMQYPSWKSFMMYAYRKRFDELLETIDALAFMNLDQRLERFFLDYFNATASTVYKGKHLDIALQLNTSREVVSRLLRKMEERGWLKTSRSSIDFSSLLRR